MHAITIIILGSGMCYRLMYLEINFLKSPGQGLSNALQKIAK